MHTPSELDIGLFSLCHGYINLMGIDAGGASVIVAKVLTGNKSPVAAETIANADRLVLTWNCHDDLLVACEAMVHAAKMNDPAAGGVAATLAFNAIAKATEQSATTP